MIKTGVDIIEITRIKKFVDENINNLERVFSIEEINYCNSKNFENNKYESFAARFAAKEAVIKALDNKSLEMKNISVVKSETGKPVVFINGSKAENISLSLSHCKDYAVAFVIIEE